jgi:hypothetical protein
MARSVLPPSCCLVWCSAAAFPAKMQRTSTRIQTQGGGNLQVVENSSDDGGMRQVLHQTRGTQQGRRATLPGVPAAL